MTVINVHVKITSMAYSTRSNSVITNISNIVTNDDNVNKNH